MARVLITGGAGFLGAHLIRDCILRGDEVVVLARPTSAIWRLHDVLPRIVLHRVHSLDIQEMGRLIRETRPERVFHLAATTRFRPRPGMAELNHAIVANVEPLQILLDTLRQLDEPPLAVVRAGTLAELGQSGTPHGPHSREQPEDAYGLSALIGTNMIRLSRGEMDLPAVTARLGLTYGGDQSSDFLIPQMIRQGLEGSLPVLRNPRARRDLLHVDDTIAALQIVADHAGSLPDTVAVSTGKPVPMSTVGTMIARLLGLPLPARPRQTAYDDVMPTLSCRP
ncbi:MAG: NAD(P)-dependent oxidoreductase, partial [Celeribacter sp.]